MGIIIRQSIKGTIVTYIGSFIGFLTTMFIVTKYLTQEELGLTRVLFDAAFILASLSMLGLPASIIKFFPHFKNENNHNNGFFFYMITIPLMGMLIFFSLFLLLKQPISNYFSENSRLFVKYYNYVIPLAFFILYWIIFESYSSVFKRIAVPKLIREVIIRLLLIVVYLLYAFRIINIDGFVACYVAVYGIAMLLVFLYVSRIGTVSLKYNSDFIDKPLKKEYISYSLFILLGAFGSTIISKIDVFMISANIGLSSTGIYTIALFMAAVIEIPSRSVSAISIPIVTEHLKNGNYQDVDNLHKKVALNQLIVGSFIFLIIWINIDNIYAIIPNGADYIAGKWAFLFLSITNMISITFNFGAFIIQYSRYYYWSTILMIILSLFTVLTNILLIPIWGVTGAAIATTITCIITYTIQQVLLFKKLKTNPFSFSIIKLLLVILGALIIHYILPTLTNHWLDGIYRTLIIGSCCGLSIYYLNISSEVNTITDMIFSFLHHKILNK